MNENEKIKEIRKVLKLTQQELADKLGVSKQYLSKVENGGTELSKEKVTILCDTYDISLDWLLLDEGQMFYKDNKAYSKMFSNMDDLNNFSNMMSIFLEYEKFIFGIIEKQYPNAIIVDKLNTAKEIFINDIAHEKIEISNIGNFEKIFKKDFDNLETKILATYFKTYVDRIEKPKTTKKKSKK